MRTPSTSSTPLPGRLRLGVAALLLVSLACNIAAVLMPFMDLRVGLVVTPYRLTNSVAMMWERGLYVLAVLVVGFSVIFPFAKLTLLARICSRPAIDAHDHLWLHWLERLGKWSMLDVFLVCIILALTTDQIFVGARPLIGIPVFTIAIILSMLSGEILSRAAGHETDTATHSPDHLRRDGCLILLAGLALIGALTFPFLEISDWKLADRGYSIVTLSWNLLRQGSEFTALIIIAFLIAAPVATLWHAARWWLGRRANHAVERTAARLRILNRWSMLDVFGLALAIFAVEGEYLMKTEVRWGALFLVALLALQKAALANLTTRGRAADGDT